MLSSLRAPPAGRANPIHRYTICKVSRRRRHRLWRRLGRDCSVGVRHWVLVDGTPLSELDFARLKAKQAPDSAAERVAVEWRRPSLNWRQTLRWTSLAVARELKTWQAALPGLLRGDFVFTLMLWVAVFTVAAAVLATPSLPLSARYAAGLAAVGY